MKKKYLGLKQQFLLLSLCSGSLMASPCQAGPTIPGFIGNTADVLPQIPAISLPTGGNIIQGIDSIRELSTSQMEITQNAPKAVIHWETFDIGSQSSVNFNQQGNSGWAALNTIGSASTSQIHGKLTADGTVYLINQNGIFFGPSAQVNVHSLTASSLNLSSSSIIEGLTESESAFVNGYSDNTGDYPSITFFNENGTGGGSVENSGAITAGNGGQVFLIGGKAVNSGTITAQSGMVVLAAGDTVTLTETTNIHRYAQPSVTTTGSTAEVTNSGGTTSGLLQADEGIVGLYGGIVNQNGRVIATSAVTRNGQIELTAHSQVNTGSGSVTSTPVNGSVERQTPSEDFTGGLITITADEFNHSGAISSPGGTVKVNPSNSGTNIHLKAGSSIDVSGLWVDQAASDRILKVQLNSDTLKDAYALKNGLLLGETVAIDILNGMQAADISEYLANRERSAAELLTNGGTIELNAGNVELAAGSSIDFSGGGYNFSAGSVEFTKVRVGSKIYDISELPAGTPVDEVLGTFTRSHDRYGISQTWSGSYYGGAMPLAESSPAFLWGGDAGALTINAAYISMAGTLDGSAISGIYQTNTKDKLYSNGKILALGRRLSSGGALHVGAATIKGTYTTAEAVINDASTYAISIVSEAVEPDTSDSTGFISYLPTSILNNAGLSTIDLAAMTIFTVEEGAELQLVPGGSFSASARQISVNGAIRTAGGDITLVTASNNSSFSTINGVANPLYLPLEESLTISGGAVLDASGERINNTGQQDLHYGYTEGGNITLMNMSACYDGSDVTMENPGHGYGLTVDEGSRLSVQGGYWTSNTGSVKGADAGSISVRQRINETVSQYLPENLTLTLDGTLEGYALLGNNGGSLTIDTYRLTVAPTDGFPASSNDLTDLQETFVLADNRFAKTGFSTINLKAYEDLTVTSGSHLQSSLLRLTEPVGLLSASPGLITALPVEAGDSVISLETVKGDLIVENGATITVAPEGEIRLHAGDMAAIDGKLEAPSGVIDITGLDVTISSTAEILAGGVNLLNTGGFGPWNENSWQTLDGGTITVSSTGINGSLILETGSLLDVSGSEAVTNTVEDSLGNMVRRSEAGSPGAIELSFVNGFTLNGTLVADSFLSGQTGGTLKITRNHSSKSLMVTENLAQALQIKGFDDLQLASAYGIEFSEALSLTASRRFVLDTPRLIGAEGVVTVEAPWVQLVNEQSNYAGTNPAAGADDPVLTVNAQSLDVKGNIQISGFSTTSLNAENAIRLSDLFYTTGTSYSGKLAVAGDLVMRAQVIYPTTGSIFTVKGSGLISILPQETSYTSPVYSAAGSLTIIGEDIYHAGYLAAPMGELSLHADDGRIILTSGSRLSVSGETEITYGKIVDGEWKVLNHATGINATATTDMTVPEPSITVSGKEVIISEDSLVDANGGGTLAAREFLAGFDGTSNPLNLENRLVIVPDNSVILPDLGQIHIEGCAALGLEAGVYSILPAEYAFLPGAIILERSPAEAFSGQGTYNLLNQPIVAGYETAYGSGAVPAAMTGYVVRSAADVLKEGNFDKQVQAMADGGNITVDGETAMILGAMTATAAANGQNGGLTIIGPNIAYEVVPAAFQSIQSIFDALPLGTVGNVYFDTHLISSDTKLGRLTLGDYDAAKDTGVTQTVTFADNMSFSGIPLVEIKAKDAITLGTGASIHALATDTDEGRITLTTKNLITKTGSLLHASDELAFNVTDSWDFQGDWQVDDGRIRLFSELISIASDAALDPDDGMFLTQSMLNAFTSVKELIIDSETDIRFLDDITLATSGSLLLDTQRLISSSLPDTPSTVTISAGSLRLENTKDALETTASLASGDHGLNLNAHSFILGPGTVRLDGFTDVDLTADGDMLFAGKGALAAMLPDAGILTMTAAGFFASYPDIGSDEVLGANTFAISSEDGDVILRKSGVTTTTGEPGSFSVTGDSVTLDGALLDFPGGLIELTATGTEADDAITLKNGAAIKAQGGIRRYDLEIADETALMEFTLAGGEVRLSAASGGIVFGDADDAAGSNSIDVSATDGIDGGRLTLAAPSALSSTLDLSRISLWGGGGAGGDFDLTVRALPELGDLASVLQAGGFTDEIRIRVREEDMSLGAGSTLTARSVYLAADGDNDPGNTEGKITIAGTINASGETGGQVAIYAKQDLTLAAGGLIAAQGASGDGGEVTLGSESGMVSTDADSTIDVTGISGTGGTVTYRVDVTGSTAEGYGVKLDAQGTVAGAGEKRLQAVKSYTYTPNGSGSYSLTNTNKNQWITDSTTIVAALAGYKTAGYTLTPEVEVNTTGDLLLPSTLTLTGLESWRPDGLPGVLTFRAGGNLNVQTSITDVPTSLNTATTKFRDITANGLNDSWSLNLIAGADFTAADPLATSAAKDLTIGKTSSNTVVVYTESGDISLAAGQDINIMPAGVTTRNFMPGVTKYTVATFDGDIRILAGRNLDLTNGGIVQSAIGDIAIATGGDVLLKGGGAIRTTGRMPTWAETDPDLYNYSTNKNTVETMRSRRFWEYRDGGDISLRVGGAVTADVEAGTGLDASTGWEGAYKDFLNVTDAGKSCYQWSANYGSITGYSITGTSATATHGIATMGGGNITITTGGDFLAQTGAFGANNEASLTILARGNLDGRFLTMQGESLLSTLGSFGVTTIGAQQEDIDTGIGIGNVTLTVQAMGSVEIGAIFNPTLANFSSTSTGNGLQSGLSYTAWSRADITAINGSALLAGSLQYLNTSNDLYNVLPGTLTMTAGQDITFMRDNFVMAPAPEGSLILLAGQDIQGRYAGSEGQADSFSSLTMSDADMDIYLMRTDDGSILTNLQNGNSDSPVHQNDTAPVLIKAGRDIAKMNFTLAKKAEIIAGRDLLNITYLGQHMHAEDQSIIAAGRDFLQPEVDHLIQTDENTPVAFQGITQAGPGSLLIQAGNNLDFADSNGVQSIGSSTNPALQDENIPLDANGRIKGSDITVIVGYDTRPSSEETADFLTQLKTVIREVSALIAAGKESEAAELKEKIRAELFTPFLYDHLSGTGNLNMTTSSLQTISGKDAINIFAAGDVNVGVTSIADADSSTIVDYTETGIFTAGGGPINLIAGQDVNVNESRVMTFLGGDIVVLSDEGNINAGRGSKAKVTAAEPQINVKKDPTTGAVIGKTVVFSPPAVGSGLRTLAYDPDGTGSYVTPEPGDMYVVAWDGVVDAGEAGIEGGNLYLAATKVLNAQNISVGAGSVGMPAASGATASLGALTGDSMSATESTTSDIAKSTAGAGDKMADTAKKIADTISQLRFFVVKFLGFME